MDNSVRKNVKLHPMRLFLLGVLTGAIGVGLFLFYKSVTPHQYESAVLQSTRSIQSISPVQMKSANLRAMPTPTGNFNALPTPTGN